MRFAVLVSGEGTNLQELLSRQDAGELAPAEIALVLSNRPEAPALSRARQSLVPTEVVDHTDFADRQSFETAMLVKLRDHRIEAVLLAGFMRILTETFLQAFKDRVINTHPSLLPAFPGMHAARQALEHGVKLAGCTVHFVEAGMDTGPIIAQESIPVEPHDNPLTLQRRIQERERAILPLVMRWLASDRLRIVDRMVSVLEAPEND